MHFNNTNETSLPINVVYTDKHAESLWHCKLSIRCYVEINVMIDDKMLKEH